MAWFIAHIVVGRKKIDSTDDKVFAEEHIMAFEGKSLEDAKQKAHKFIDEYQVDPGKLLIINPSDMSEYPSQFVGIHMRGLVDIRRLADDIEDEGNIHNKSELSYMPIVLKNEKEFYDYAKGAKKRKSIKITVYTDPDDYHFGA